MNQRAKFSELVYGSIALAFLVGAVLAVTQRALAPWQVIVFGVLVVLCSYFIIKPRQKSPAAPQAPVWVPEADSNTVPRVNSRRWARANFHSGIISLPELHEFMVSHPERADDPDR